MLQNHIDVAIRYWNEDPTDPTQVALVLCYFFRLQWLAAATSAAAVVVVLFDDSIV